jgi:hypothetical protein
MINLLFEAAITVEVERKERKSSVDSLAPAYQGVNQSANRPRKRGRVGWGRILGLCGQMEASDALLTPCDLEGSDFGFEGNLSRKHMYMVALE